MTFGRLGGRRDSGRRGKNTVTKDLRGEENGPAWNINEATEAYGLKGISLEVWMMDAKWALLVELWGGSLGEGAKHHDPFLVL
jgi:hypothetical protein